MSCMLLDILFANLRDLLCDRQLNIAGLIYSLNIPRPCRPKSVGSSWAGEMSSLDSEAFFTSRCAGVGLSPATVAAMVAQGWVTVATFAFGTAYSPGQADDKLFVDQILKPLFGDPPASNEIPKVRRLFYECHSVSVADLRNKVERLGDEAKPLAMATEERQVRLERLRNRLRGLDISGPLEPSHRLCDKYYAMVESGQLVWLPWDEMTSREQEVLGVKKNDLEAAPISEIKADAAGYLRSSKAAVELKADTTSDLLLLCALQRRALAMELAGMTSYEACHAVTQKYFRAYQTPPLPGFSKVTVHQLIQADKSAFVRLSELTKGSLKRDVHGNLPLEAALKEVVTEHDFNYLLMQMPSKGGAGQASGERRERSRSRRQNSKPQHKGKQDGGKGSSKPPQGKQEAGKQATGPKDGDGKNICFAFQRKKGCSAGGPGAECPRGRHVCWVKKCWGQHAGCDHGH